MFASLPGWFANVRDGLAVLGAGSLAASAVFGVLAARAMGGLDPADPADAVHADDWRAYVDAHGLDEDPPG
ncbi:MAG TPA: hypothetical protein VGL93_10365 [Streptosporangiaceae bacterium]|jgi:hypothetical protein